LIDRLGSLLLKVMGFSHITLSHVTERVI